MRRAALLLAIVLLAGCGGSSKPKAPADPGKAAFDSLSSALARGDRAAVWELLAPASQRRLGPTLADFKSSKLGLSLRGPYRTVVSELVTPTVGVLAVDAGSDVHAFVLSRDAHGVLRFVLGSPVSIDILGPQPGPQTVPVVQVGIEIRGAVDADLWLDGLPLPGKAYGARSRATVFANLPARVAKGRHVVVAFAENGHDATARAWAFVVPD
jgi:hypothetical protein